MGLNFLTNQGIGSYSGSQSTSAQHSRYTCDNRTGAGLNFANMSDTVTAPCDEIGNEDGVALGRVCFLTASRDAGDGGGEEDMLECEKTTYQNDCTTNTVEHTKQFATLDTVGFDDLENDDCGICATESVDDKYQTFEVTEGRLATLSTAMYVPVNDDGMAIQNGGSFEIHNEVQSFPDNLVPGNGLLENTVPVDSLDDNVAETYVKPQNGFSTETLAPSSFLPALPLWPMPSKQGRGRQKAFHCKSCQLQVESEAELVQHFRTHGDRKLQIEEQAERMNLDSGNVSSHTADGKATGGNGISSMPRGPIRCEECGYNTSRYDHYLAHLKHHEQAGGVKGTLHVLSCTLCPYSTVSRYHWKKHLRNHFPCKVYTCSECSYFSDRKNNYLQHMRTHTGERPYCCPHCSYRSSQKTHLTRHMRVHSGEKPFKCMQCSYVAANQHEVTRHFRQVHNGPKPFGCEHCNYRTADRSNYKKHVELHTRPRQFHCPVCHYAASKKCNLQYHIRSKHPDSNLVTMDVSHVRLRGSSRGRRGVGMSKTGIESKVTVASNTEDDVESDFKDSEKGNCDADHMAFVKKYNDDADDGMVVGKEKADADEGRAIDKDKSDVKDGAVLNNGKNDVEIGAPVDKGKSNVGMGILVGKGKRHVEKRTLVGKGKSDIGKGTTMGKGRSDVGKGTPVRKSKSGVGKGTPVGKGKSDLEKSTPVEKGKSDVDKGTPVGKGKGDVDKGTPVGKGKSDVDKGTPVGKGKSDVNKGTPVGKGKNNVEMSTPVGKGKSDVDKGTPVGKGKSDVDKGTPVGKGKSDVDKGTPVGKGKNNVEMSTPVGKGKSDVDKGTPVGKGKSDGDKGTPVGKGKNNVEMSTPVGKGKNNVEMGTPVGKGKSDVENGTPVGKGKRDVEMGTPVGKGKSSIEKGTPVGKGKSSVEKGTPVGKGKSNIEKGTPVSKGKSDIKKGTPVGKGEGDVEMGTPGGKGKSDRDDGTPVGKCKSNIEKGTPVGKGKSNIEKGTPVGKGKSNIEKGTPVGKGKSNIEKGTPVSKGKSDVKKGTPVGKGESDEEMGTPGGKGKSDVDKGTPVGKGKSDVEKGTPVGKGESDVEKGTPVGKGESDVEKGTPVGKGMRDVGRKIRKSKSTLKSRVTIIRRKCLVKRDFMIETSEGDVTIADGSDTISRNSTNSVEVNGAVTDESESDADESVFSAGSRKGDVEAGVCVTKKKERDKDSSVVMVKRKEEKSEGVANALRSEVEVESSKVDKNTQFEETGDGAERGRTESHGKQISISIEGRVGEAQKNLKTASLSPKEIMTGEQDAVARPNEGSKRKSIDQKSNNMRTKDASRQHGVNLQGRDKRDKVNDATKEGDSKSSQKPDVSKSEFKECGGKLESLQGSAPRKPADMCKRHMKQKHVCAQQETSCVDGVASKREVLLEQTEKHVDQKLGLCLRNNRATGSPRKRSQQTVATEMQRSILPKRLKFSSPVTPIDFPPTEKPFAEWYKRAELRNNLTEQQVSSRGQQECCNTGSDCLHFGNSLGSTDNASTVGEGRKMKLVAERVTKDGLSREEVELPNYSTEDSNPLDVECFASMSPEFACALRLRMVCRPRDETGVEGDSLAAAQTKDLDGPRVRGGEAVTPLIPNSEKVLSLRMTDGAIRPVFSERTSEDEGIDSDTESDSLANRCRRGLFTDSNHVIRETDQTTDVNFHPAMIKQAICDGVASGGQVSCAGERKRSMCTETQHADLESLGLSDRRPKGEKAGCPSCVFCNMPFPSDKELGHHLRRHLFNVVVT